LRVPHPPGSDEALAAELLKRSSVLAHPGKFFNFAQDAFLVLSLISPEKDFQEGCRRLKQFFG
jgi:aspartate/methionine/tyrosine aminotransferase